MDEAEYDTLEEACTIAEENSKKEPDTTYMVVQLLKRYTSRVEIDIEDIN